MSPTLSERRRGRTATPAPARPVTHSDRVAAVIVVAAVAGLVLLGLILLALLLAGGFA